MNTTPTVDARRELPSVTAVLKHQCIKKLETEVEAPYLTRIIRQVLSAARRKKISLTVEETATQVATQTRRLLASGYRPVINLTGVVLHTNLGRAPLASGALKTATDIGSGYTNLEFNTDTLKRGSRDAHLRDLLSILFDAEQALVVNNAAAALVLCLNTLSRGQQTIVSRGELIEIGGSFRLPQIMESAGCKLVEVGTTNRTYLKDFESAVNDATGAILRAHPSNYQLAGFTTTPSLTELAQLTKRSGIPLIYDLGSGRPALEASADEVTQALSQGADLVIFSGDKVLGGPQAGIVVGKQSIVDQLRQAPLFRALRLDKLTLSALDWTLIQYLKGTEQQSLPTQAMLSRSEERIHQLARLLADAIEPSIIKLGGHVFTERSLSTVGAGSWQNNDLPTYVVRIQFNDEKTLRQLVRDLASNSPAIIGRQEQGMLSFDLRSLVEEKDIEALSLALKEFATLASA